MTSAINWILRLLIDAVVARGYFQNAGVYVLSSVMVDDVKYCADGVTIEWRMPEVDP